MLRISGCVGGIQPGGWRDRKKIENLIKQNVLWPCDHVTKCVCALHLSRGPAAPGLPHHRHGSSAEGGGAFSDRHHALRRQREPWPRNHLVQGLPAGQHVQQQRTDQAAPIRWPAPLALSLPRSPARSPAHCLRLSLVFAPGGFSLSSSDSSPPSPCFAPTNLCYSVLFQSPLWCCCCFSLLPLRRRRTSQPCFFFFAVARLVFVLFHFVFCFFPKAFFLKEASPPLSPGGLPVQITITKP